MNIGVIRVPPAPWGIVLQYGVFLRLPDLAQGCYLNATLQSLLTLRLLRQEMEQTEKAVHSLCTAAQVHTQTHSHEHTHTHTHTHRD